MKHLKYLLLSICTLVTITGFAKNAPIDTSNTLPSYVANDQAPIGVIIDRVHDQGRWMATYSYSNIVLQGNQTGRTKVGNDIVNQYYQIAPDKMNVQTHIATLMYGVSDRFTLIATGGYAVNNLTMTAASIYPLVETSTHVSRSSAFTDTKVFASYNFLNAGNNSFTATLGVNLPTGTVTATGTNISGQSRRLPYLMQTGSGTYGLLPSITYLNAIGPFTYGAQANADINIGKNNQGYSFGNIYNATAWASYRIIPILSVSIRAAYISTGKISGSDPYINYYLNNDPASDNRDYGGKEASFYPGLNFSVPKVTGLHLLVEYGIPFYQNLDGLQMSLHSTFLASIQYHF